MHHRPTISSGCSGLIPYLALRERSFRSSRRPGKPVTWDLKLLPDHFADDPERLARFQREAQVLASLNHPNIAQIHGLEDSTAQTCIVMELVEGETLQERLKRGRTPLDEALPMAAQIAVALEAAHERGIVHRDLKPANIKLTPDGKVKVLDFGLAKAFQKEDLPTLSNSPTLMSASVAGVILGTAAYMSPEQAKGKEADRTSDMWSFGCVLYETLTGHAVFEGETVGEILGGVFKAEPDWQRLPVETPEAIRRLLRRCLQKDRTRRLKSADDARIEIEEALAGSTTTPEVRVAASSKKRGWLAWAIALALGAALASVFYLNRIAPPAPEIRVEVNTPTTADPASFAISPDGRRLVFSASNEGKSQLWVRPLDSVAAKPLAGTDGASYPFWSPDSASVGFFAGSKLKRIDILGGVPQVIADASVNGLGGTWNREGTILFNSVAGGPLFRVSATGGEPPVAVTRLETGQTFHVSPQFLPDGRHFNLFRRKWSPAGY